MGKTGYLLDTNHVNAYFDEHPGFKRKLQADPQNIFFISAISLGEIEASNLNAGRDPEVVRRFQKFVRATFLSAPKELTFALPVDETSREWYAQIIYRILLKHPLPSLHDGIEKHLSSLGVGINDVWIFATAWNHNLTLLTTDRMKLIRGVVPHTEVLVENWM